MQFVRTILLAFTMAAAFLAPAPALAQGCGAQNPNCIVPSAPAGSNNNQAASTAFVQSALSGGALAQSANTIFAGPTSGAAAAPGFRALVDGDLPIVSLAHGGLGGSQAAATANQVALFPGSGGAAVPTTITPGIIGSLGTGVATALAVNVATAGAFVVNGGALGSPSSAGTLPAHTLGGTISGGGNQINNVIIGTTTPLAGAFTTLAGTQLTLAGISQPKVVLSPSSGATKTAQLYQIADVFNIAATAVADWLAIDLGTGQVSVLAGNLVMGTAAKTLVLKQGANGAVGTFICTSGGTITITNSNVAITDTIPISLNTVGGTISTNPTVNAITASTSFTVKCATSDTSTYNYSIIKNAAWLLKRDLDPAANDNTPAFMEIAA
jgi:hypothetical protein